MAVDVLFLYTAIGVRALTVNQHSLGVTGVMKKLRWLIAIGMCLLLATPAPAQAAAEAPVYVKELNFVFLHGAGGCICSLQLLADFIEEKLPDYIADYEQAGGGTRVRADVLQRCVPSDVDIDTWAQNIADMVADYLPGKENIILIGHSMGGKAALYAVAHDVGGLAEKAAMVVTINSPIKRLHDYQLTGGGSARDYCRARWLFADKGVCNSIAYYDSSQDGLWVSQNKHWLAFISSEAAPLGEQFNIGGIDALPRDMDDNIIPLSAQYTEAADVVYYGEYDHGDFSESVEVSEFMAEQILNSIFGGDIACSVSVRSGNFAHKADWLLGTDHWSDAVGEILTASGTIEHRNASYFRWQEWEDVVGDYIPGYQRSSYEVSRGTFFPFFTGVVEARWLESANPEDGRLYVRTRAAPRGSVRVEWGVYHQGLLPEGVGRDHYEIEIAAGTPFTGIRQVSWLSDDPRDLRILINSEAESPFRWFRAEWRLYAQEKRYRQLITNLPGFFEGGTPD